MDALRSILGEGVSDDILAGLLRKYGEDVAAAANAFFDGGPAAAAPARRRRRPRKTAAAATWATT